ncbi:MAG TPA: glycosyltransferase [Blastocatellia bacterium]|jgi:phosphatidylinositol alpha 1,6-mannosyltransferase
MKTELRVAFFTDSYLEVNGVAHTSRQLAAFAREHGLPFLCVHAGDQTRTVDEGSLRRLSLKRTKLGFALDADLRFDLLMWRHAKLAIQTVREFNPDVIHITGPSDIGLLGVYIARKLHLPIVMSWHTNVHEYAAERLAKLLPFLPDVRRFSLAGSAQSLSLKLILQFYKLGKVFLAPNEELGGMIERNLNRPVFMMRRGVDTNLFSPAKRARKDGLFNIGYVGRLTPEKNVRLLAQLEKGLLKIGAKGFRFVIVGTGSEREWLEQQMLPNGNAELPGVLKGEALARAYANLDLFIFPSHTDTFGNVVLEAQASGVPAIVSDQGGPKFIIEDGETGLIAKTEKAFLKAILSLMDQPELHQRMREAARERACRASWESVFRQVYQAYEVCVQRAAAERAVRQPLSNTAVSSDAVS